MGCRFFTYRDTFHKVDSDGTSIILNFRGSLVDRWKESLPGVSEYLTLPHGRKVVRE